jgi:hypothetical protein
MAVEQAAKRFSARRDRWMQQYGPQYADKPQGSIEATLEHHVRSDFIDDVLRALNWSLTIEGAQEPNLLAELPIVSPDTGRTKFIDYLGLQTETNIPLLIVETKRFGAPLPHNPKSPENDVPVLLAEALAGKKDRLTHDWPEWLTTLGGYVRAAHEHGRSPRRAVMTDGRWLIAFNNPQATFIAGRDDVEAIQARDILFFTLDDIASNHGAIFDLLEYQKVVGDHRPMALCRTAISCTRRVRCVPHAWCQSAVHRGSGLP